MDITSNIFYKWTATFRTQICRKCLRIKLNGFRSVSTLVDITSNIFYKCTATFRTHICRFTLTQVFDISSAFKEIRSHHVTTKALNWTLRFSGSLIHCITLNRIFSNITFKSIIESTAIWGALVGILSK
jgi:hypothetical protein